MTDLLKSRVPVSCFNREAHAAHQFEHCRIVDEHQSVDFSKTFFSSYLHQAMH